MKKWNAVILAGDRSKTDSVAQHTQVNCKAEVVLAGKTLLERVIVALAKSTHISKIFTVGPDPAIVKNIERLNELLKRYNITSLPIAEGPSLSALQGVQASSNYPTLVLTCDLPLLNTELVECYFERIAEANADFVIGAVEHKYIAKLLPNLKKTSYLFGSQSVCFANLFAVLSEKGMHAIQYWQDIEGSRKKPLAVIKRVGWTSVLRYKAGLLDIDHAAQQLSRKTGARIAILDIDFPELAIDVDSVDDFEQLQNYLS